MKFQARDIFSWLVGLKPAPSSDSDDPEEAIVGKYLSLDLFKKELEGLGYDFEVYTQGDGKIYRFKRINKPSGYQDGDVW